MEQCSAMQVLILLLSIASYCTAGICLAMAWHIWRQHRWPGSLSLAWLALSIAFWMSTFSLELGATGFVSKLFWAKLQYAGIVSAPLAWFVLCSHFDGVKIRLA